MGRVRSGSGVPQPDPRGFGLTKTQAQPKPQPARAPAGPRAGCQDAKMGDDEVESRKYLDRLPVLRITNIISIRI